MAKELDYPAYLWTKVVNTSTYLSNRNPIHSNGGLSLKHVYNGKTLDLNHLKVINNLAYIHVSKSKRSKLETKSIKCMTLGYNDWSKAYRCFDPKEKKVLINKYVVFNERIIGLFTLLWKQAFKFDNTAIPLALYNLEASHGDQGSINVNSKSMIHDDEPSVDEPSLHGNESLANDDDHSNDQSHHFEHEVVQHPKEVIQLEEGFTRWIS